MEPVLSCIPCIIKQIIYTARAVSGDAWLQKQVVTTTLKSLAELEYTTLPVSIVSRMFKNAVTSLGVTDPFQPQQDEIIDNFSDILAMIQKRAVEVDSDRLTAALKMAAVANHFPGMIDFKHTLDRIVRLAKSEPVFFEYDRFFRESRKKNKVVLFAGGFIEFPFDVYLLSLLGMNEICITSSAKPYLWALTADDIKRLGKKLPFNAELSEIVYTNPKQDYNSLLNDEDLFICKGFINYQFFHKCEQMLVHLFYANNWCLPCMTALELKNNRKSGTVLKFNV